MNMTPDSSPEARGARFVEALERRGMKGADLARRLGLENEQNITNWKSRGVSRRYLIPVARELFVQPEWLDSGVEEELKLYHTKEEWAEFGPEKELRSINMIPVLGKAKLGDEGYFDVMDYPVGQGDGYLHATSHDPAAYAVRVNGHSMRPRIKDGEFVVIEPNRAAAPGDEVLVRTNDGKCMVKEYLYYRDGTYCLGSVNQEVANIFEPLDNIAVMHVVAGIYKSHLHYPD